MCSVCTASKCLAVSIYWKQRHRLRLQMRLKLHFVCAVVNGVVCVMMLQRYPVTNCTGIRIRLLCKLNELRCQGRLLCNCEQLVLFAVNIVFLSFLVSFCLYNIMVFCICVVYAWYTFFCFVSQPQEHRILSVINIYSHSGTQLSHFTSWLNYKYV